MCLEPTLIQGGRHTDYRGTLTFLNDFDMTPVRRFYIVENRDIETIRAWRAHKIEQRWFYASEGEFLIKLVKIDDFNSPSRDLPIDQYSLSAKNNQILHIPAGYGSSVQATLQGSKLIVFADYGIENAKLDDYLYSQDYFEK